MLVVSSNYLLHLFIFFFFFNHTPPTNIYTLSLHDALPISLGKSFEEAPMGKKLYVGNLTYEVTASRSEEHTSELQSHHDLVCRLLLEKKKNKTLELNQYHLH